MNDEVNFSHKIQAGEERRRARKGVKCDNFDKLLRHRNKRKKAERVVEADSEKIELFFRQKKKEELNSSQKIFFDKNTVP